MFKKDDYIVCLEGKFSPPVGMGISKCGRKNFIVKQSITREFLDIEKGIGLDVNDVTSGNRNNYMFTFDKRHWLKDWRYATSEEIEEYERLGHPYDVTTLKVFKNEDTYYLIELFVKNNIL